MLSINYNTTETMQWWAHEYNKMQQNFKKQESPQNISSFYCLDSLLLLCGVNVGGKYLELCVGLCCAINIVSFTCSSLGWYNIYIFYVLFFFTLFMFLFIFYVVCCCIWKLYEYYFNVNSFGFLFHNLYEFSFIWKVFSCMNRKCLFSVVQLWTYVWVILCTQRSLSFCWFCICCCYCSSFDVWVFLFIILKVILKKSADLNVVWWKYLITMVS